MKFMILAAGIAVLSMPAFAAKPCEALKGEIAAKIDAKGVPQYTLTIVPAADVGERTVVGSCDAGANRIVYVRGAAAAAPAAAAPAAPAPTP